MLQKGETMKKLLIALLAVGMAAQMQASPDAKKNTKDERQYRMKQNVNDKENRDRNKQQEKAARKKEAQKRIGVVTKTYNDLEQKKMSLVEELESNRCEFKEAKSEKRRETDAYKSKRNKDQADQDLKDAFVARKYASANEADQITQDIKALNGDGNTDKMNDLEERRHEILHKLVQVDEKISDAREDARRTYSKAGKYDEWCELEASKAAEHQLRGHDRMHAWGVNRGGEIHDRFFSKGGKLRSDEREKLRQEWGWKKNEIRPRRTCRQQHIGEKNEDHQKRQPK